MGEVIEVDCNGFLPEELNALHTDLLVLASLGLGLRIWLKRFCEFVNATLLTRFIGLHQNDLFKRQGCLIAIFKILFKFGVIFLFVSNFDGNKRFLLKDCGRVLI